MGCVWPSRMRALKPQGAAEILQRQLPPQDFCRRGAFALDVDDSECGLPDHRGRGRQSPTGLQRFFSASYLRKTSALERVARSASDYGMPRLGSHKLADPLHGLPQGRQEILAQPAHGHAIGQHADVHRALPLSSWQCPLKMSKECVDADALLTLWPPQHLEKQHRLQALGLVALCPPAVVPSIVRVPVPCMDALEKS